MPTIPDTGPYVDDWYGQYTNAQALIVAAALAPIPEDAQHAAVRVLEQMGTHNPDAETMSDHQRERYDAIISEALEAAETWLNNHRAHPGRTYWGPSELGDAWGHWPSLEPHEWPEIEYTATIIDANKFDGYDADPVAAEGWAHPSFSTWTLHDEPQYERLEPYTPDGRYNPTEIASRLADIIAAWTGHVDHLDDHADRITTYPSDAVTDYSGTYGTPLARYSALRYTHARGLTDAEIEATRLELERRGLIQPQPGRTTTPTTTVQVH
jgi:hypothetical protein